MTQVSSSWPKVKTCPDARSRSVDPTTIQALRATVVSVSMHFYSHVLKADSAFYWVLEHTCLKPPESSNKFFNSSARSIKKGDISHYQFDLFWRIMTMNTGTFGIVPLLLAFLIIKVE